MKTVADSSRELVLVADIVAVVDSVAVSLQLELTKEAQEHLFHQPDTKNKKSKSFKQSVILLYAKFINNYIYSFPLRI